MLEEQLRDVDNKSQQLFIDEQKKHRDALVSQLCSFTITNGSLDSSLS